MHYVTEYNIYCFDICNYPVFVSMKFVTKFCPRMLIWSVSVDHNSHCHEAQINFYNISKKTDLPKYGTKLCTKCKQLMFFEIHFTQFPIR